MKPKNLDPLVNLAATLNHRTNDTPRANYSGRIWPNGSFTLGYLPASRPGGPIESLQGLEQDFDLVSGEVDGGESRALTLSYVRNSETAPKRSRYGLKGITRDGRRMLENGCFLMEQRLGKSDCGFVTLTVPPLNKEARRVLALNWPKVTNELLKYLSRRLSEQGRPSAIAGCVEIQTGRLAKYREGYLHLHLVCPLHGNRGQRYALGVDRLRTWWKGCLERHSGTTLPSLPRVQIEPVQKSVEAYMGKYLSKGCQADLDAYVADLGEESVPGQWWFMTEVLKDKVRSGCVEGSNTGHVLNAVIQYALECGNLDAFVFIQPVDVEIAGCIVHRGWVGRFTEEERDSIIDFCRP